MLAQAETKSKAPFGNCNGRLNKSDGLDPQFAKLKKELILAQREISNLKNQLHQVKENIAKERAEHGSKSKKDDSPDEEVDSKRVRQQAKRAPRHRGRELHHQVRHGMDSRCFRLVITVTRRWRRKMIIRNRMQEQHTRRQSLLAFNQLSRRRLHKWMLSPDLQGQGRASCNPYSSAIDRLSERFFARG
jgi:hypothetical protein